MTQVQQAANACAAIRLLDHVCVISGHPWHRLAFGAGKENRAVGSALWQTDVMLTPILALVVIALVSLLAVRVGATALMMTGLSWDTASFQAYSAFFGVGFTTREAEMVVNQLIPRIQLCVLHTCQQV
jgi:Trk-type K+ transport system membrane component